MVVDGGNFNYWPWGLGDQSHRFRGHTTFFSSRTTQKGNIFFKMSPAIVGALACQKNSFLKTLQTTVVSCKEYTPIATSKDKQNKNLKQAKPVEERVLYAVELEDTILFPEGGGQPHDVGFINVQGSERIPVTQVVRDRLTAVHVTPRPVTVGSKVTLDIDWDRRIDIMQQHTGQHLLSAVLDTYDLETLSWSMGNPINYLEIPRRLEDHEIIKITAKINELIVQNQSIEVHTPDKDGHDIDTSHVPDDYDLSQGILRVVKIGNIDANPCCGTHLTSTGQIQAISLFHQTNIRGGNSRLHFACGARVASLAQGYHKLLKDVLGVQLSCQIEEVGLKVAELVQNQRKLQSRESSLVKELASMKAAELFDQIRSKKGDTFSVYREDSSAEYLNQVQKELDTLIKANPDSDVKATDYTVIYLNGDYKSGLGGMVKVVGPKADQIQADLKTLLSNIKGGGRGSTFQGKISKYEKGEVENVLNYFELLHI